MGDLDYNYDAQPWQSKWVTTERRRRSLIPKFNGSRRGDPQVPRLEPGVGIRPQVVLLWASGVVAILLGGFFLLR